MTEKTHNRLINEKSPYLLQHAYNPVQWYPWGEEAFEKAKNEDKPIFLSIGYSTCHWCHVMERESFEDEEVAEVLNKYFISIKVDREERPDVDSIYMTFCQAYTGSGGWPLTIIMTPDKHPFFAGTYFPKRGKYGMMGIIDILEHIEELWQNEREKCTRISKEILEEIKKYSTNENYNYEELDESIVNETVMSFKQHFQNNYGGFSRAPKFPTPHSLYFLLRYYYTNKDEEVLNMVENTLQHMYKGGIFDHIGFGFSRYSTDEKWLVPHFEKMLYDNALLSLAYTEAYSLTGKEIYKDVAEKIYTYILRDMTDFNGGFYSAEDADSEGVEGKFYLWTFEELEQVLGKDKAQLYAETYDITRQGNFEGKNIPNLILTDLDKMQNQTKNIDIDELESCREKLFEYREQRIHPFKDDKILTSWNGLMITSLSYAGKVFNNDKYIDSARKAADFILKNLVRGDGRLLARYREGEAANLGVLDDYSFLTCGLIELYEACFEVKYLKKALELNNQMIKIFMDEETSGFYLYGNDSEELIIRPKDIYDGAVPSGNSVAALNLLKIAKLTGNQKYSDIVEKQIDTFGAEIKRNPLAYVNFITAFMYSRMPIKEVVLAGNKSDDFITKALLKIDGIYNPYQVLILNDGNEELFDINKFIRNQQKIDGKDSIYICENYSCSKPITDLNQLDLIH